MSNVVHNLIIIGSGPAGLTAGIYASRANLKPLIIEGKEPGGQLMGTTYVENWPGEISILGPKLMMNMKEHAKHYGCTFESGDVIKVDFTKKPFTIWTEKKEFKAHSVVIATGSTPKRLGVPGEDAYWGKGLTTCAVCDGAFYPDKKVIIIGGGDTSMEDSSFMTKFTDKITIVQILDKLTASHAMQQRVLNNPKINIIYNGAVSEILGNGDHVTGLKYIDKISGESKQIDADGIFLAIGLDPNTTPFKGQIDLDQWGYLKIHDNTRTSIEGVFAAGDVFDFRYKQAVTSAGSGCKAALDAERYLSETV